MRTIKVTKSAGGKFAPDSIEVKISLNAEHKKYGEAIKLLNEHSENMNSLLMDAGLKKGDATTSGACVSHEKRDGKSVFCGRADITVRLPLADERADAVLEAVQKSGFAWSQSYARKDSSYKSELIAAAVKAAREAAQTIASAAGVKLGALTNVEYVADFGGAPRLMRAMSAVEPEQIEASETVTCEWEIA